MCVFEVCLCRRTGRGKVCSFVQDYERMAEGIAVWMSRHAQVGVDSGTDAIFALWSKLNDSATSDLLPQ